MELFSPLHLKFGWERHMMRFNEGIEAINAVKRVRELHKLYSPEGVLFCDYCFESYPCPTIKALDGE